MSRCDLTKTSKSTKVVKEQPARTKLAFSNDTVSIECKLTVRSETEERDLRKAIEFLQLLLEQEHGY